MTTVWWRSVGVLACLIVLAATAQAQNNRELRTFLQNELNEVALLSAQSNALQQQGDTVGAATVASYIPDHRVMIGLWASILQQRGDNPNNLQARITPRTGSRLNFVETDIDAHQRIVNDYARLARTTRDPVIRQVALIGQGGATHHLLSLQVARGATLGTPRALGEATVAALALEQATITDLQTQAARAVQVGDQATANLLLSMVPCHQQQAVNLGQLAQQLGADLRAPLPPVVAFNTVPEIIQHFRITSTQLTNTYALALQPLSPGPLQQVMANGQSLSFNALASLPQITTAGVAGLGTPGMVSMGTMTPMETGVATTGTVGVTTY